MCVFLFDVLMDVTPFLNKINLSKLSCSFKLGYVKAIIDDSKILRNFTFAGVVRSIFQSNL